MVFTGADMAQFTRNDEPFVPIVPDDDLLRVADRLAHPGAESGDNATAALSLSQRIER